MYEDIFLYARQERFMGCPPYEQAILLARSLSSPSSVDLGQYVKRLWLHKVTPFSGAVEQILSQTNNLTRFECEFKIFGNTDGTCIDTQSLANALCNVSRTLEDLNITYCFQRNEGRNVEYTVTHTASFLKHMIKLKALNMPISLLLGCNIEEAPGIDEVLPPGLVHLSLDNEDPWLNHKNWIPSQIIRVVNEFVDGERWRGFTPHLESISVHDHAWVDWSRGGMVNYYIFKEIVEKASLRYFSSVAGIRSSSAQASHIRRF
jgi:hypothetical protein